MHPSKFNKNNFDAGSAITVKEQLKNTINFPLTIFQKKKR